MDELDEVRALRDDTPDDAAKDAALRSLRARIDAPAPARGSQRARAAGSRGAGGPGWPRLPRVTRWLVPAATLAIVAIAVIALWPAADGGGEGRGTPFAPATASAALERAADAAQDTSERPLKPGEFFYVHDRSAYLMSSAGEGGSWSVLLPTERETWTGRDGHGRYVAKDTGSPEFPGPKDREHWKAQGSMPLARPPRPVDSATFGTSGFGAGGSMLSYEQLSALPSEGKAMYRKLIELANGAGPSPDIEAFVIIGDLLRSAPVPPDVRAGLYRAAAHIKGVRYAGEVTDALGRKGLAVELTDGEQRRRLVFDPETSQLLGEQDVLIKRVPYIDADPGFVAGYRLVLEQGIVASDHARP